MELPVFYAPDIRPDDMRYTMNEDTSKYCIQVLRHENGDQVLLADGRGQKFTAEIADDNRKKCVLKILHTDTIPAREPALRIAISFTKNTSRIEWFLEKAAEIGIHTIIPLVSQRTEKEKIKAERLQNILVSAMLQSQQFYLPVLEAPQSFEQVVNNSKEAQQFIAHCLPEEKKTLQDTMQAGRDTLILIGPEGDFTPEEIKQALSLGFVPVSLGNTRLRTETAGMVAVTLMNAKQ
ncbi:16S rRNA (uracil(1498)-N(3))-methyltransferase [Chitinophaga nivalis]|uniref:Ribosomal RNA small subunit methyltransferase E n=1 Tax=Chitinophaga nivalis TaxID=2991709 RepID=A0ABT3IU29_9BACT|nr:16S rRNA (uracil(1498)-N(3))-methyltransferase [Chitinophaga nivalis]MCW3463101.1 16S rRNA (uracil(1498)-N(3))-methyltransferase [Chitinophaga nivalis]MCW3487209.1 16S rRNA (uracil(1498)-N(3))-methyltransferase [Chitinophaga nivalis]